MTSRRDEWLERVRSVDASAATEIEHLQEVIAKLRTENASLERQLAMAENGWRGCLRAYLTIVAQQEAQP